MRAKAILLGTMFAGSVMAGTSVGLLWDPSPDAVQGYNIYFGVVGGSQTNVATLGNVTNVVFQNLNVGMNYFFFATAYDANGAQSDPTPAITYTTPPNNTPTLSPIADGIADEGKLFQVKASASDSDVPAQTLRFSLGADAPAGATIDVSTGVFSWTPTSSQVPSTNRVTIIVTDNGTPAQSASQTFTILAREGFYLTVNSQNGTVQINPKGTLNSAGTKYINGTQVGANAQPALGYGFDHWTLNGATYTANPLNFTMDRNQTLTASFALLGGLISGAQTSPTTTTTTASATTTTTTSPTTATASTSTTTTQPVALSYVTTTNQTTTTTNALVVETSTNLVDWTAVAVAPTTDTNAVYRVVAVPLAPAQ